MKKAELKPQAGDVGGEAREDGDVEGGDGALVRHALVELRLTSTLDRGCFEGFAAAEARREGFGAVGAVGCLVGGRAGKGFDCINSD